MKDDLKYSHKSKYEDLSVIFKRRRAERDRQDTRQQLLAQAVSRRRKLINELKNDYDLSDPVG